MEEGSGSDDPAWGYGDDWRVSEEQSPSSLLIQDVDRRPGADHMNRYILLAL